MKVTLCFSETHGAASVNAEQEEHSHDPMVILPIQETGKGLDENRVPESAWQDQFAAKGRRYLSNNLHNTIIATTAEHLSQTFQVNAHKTNYENIDNSTIDTDRGDVEPSTAQQSEKTIDASIKIRHEAGMKCCRHCVISVVIFRYF